MCKSPGHDSRNAADLQLWTFEAPDIDLGFNNNDLQPELQKSSDLADFRKTLGLVLILNQAFCGSGFLSIVSRLYPKVYNIHHRRC
jgi:hypothetical protein